MTIKELVYLRKETFEAIDTLIDKGHYGLAQLRLDVDQPDEWIIREQSRLIEGTFYCYNHIQLIEAIMDRVFEWSVHIMGNQITQSKDKFASTVSCRVEYSFKKDMNRKLFVVSGIATEPASSIEMLQLKTPLAFVSAKKNAIKQIGNLYGKSLNRNLEDSVPDIQVEKEKDIDSEFIEVKGKIHLMAWQEDARDYLDTTPFRLHKVLKDLVAQKPFKIKL